MPEHPDLTAIIVSWNVRAQLERCLLSLAGSNGPHLRVIVIDNASTDGSAEMVRKNFPHVTLIANTSNRGFAAAVNQGLQGSQGDIILVNPDLTVTADTINHLEQALGHDPHAGIAGPKILYPNGTVQPSIRRFPTTRDLFLTLLKIPNFFPFLVAHYAGLDIDYNQEQVVDQVMGSCFLIRRAALDEIGTFDENFYIWFEEVDYCQRGLEHGWKTIYVPSAEATHEKGASFSQQSPLWKQRVLTHSMTHYAKKHLGFWSGEIIAATGLASLLLSGLQQLLHLKKPAVARDL